MKTKSFKLRCPNCHEDFTISDDNSLWEKLKQSVSSEMDELIQSQKTELQKKQDEYQKLLQQKVNETKILTLAESSEKHRLEVMQKEKLISDLKAQLDVAKNKIEQNSQLVGEVQELRIEEILEETFKEFGDRVIPVGKGVNGADCCLEVTSGSTIMGRILVESKSTSSFSKKWIDKLKEDNKNSYNAEICLIVTKSMPRGFENEKFTVMDNVFICQISFLKTLVTFLRYSICKVAELKLKYNGKSGKEHLLFTYITSPEFENLSKSCLGQLENLKLSMEAEKKRLIKAYTEREQEIAKAISSLIGYFGNINGIVSNDSMDNISKAS